MPECGRYIYGHPGGTGLSKILISNLGLERGAKVLDFGCGSGETLTLLRDDFGLDAIGADSDKEAVKACKERDPSLTVRRVRDNVLDFPSLSFDGVIAECSLSAVANDSLDEYLHEFYCVLKRGGKLAVSDVYDKTAEPELITRLFDAGFKVTSWEDCSRVLGSYLAELIMNGYDTACKSYDKNTGYYVLIAEKP